jgi:hypothetical protein
MTCHYCGEYDTRLIDDERVCVYCFEHLQHVPSDDRETFIDGRLKKLHALLVGAHSTSPYVKVWAESVAKRIAFLRDEHTAPVPDRAKAVVPIKIAGPLKLKIKKFR